MQIGNLSVLGEKPVSHEFYFVKMSFTKEMANLLWGPISHFEAVGSGFSKAPPDLSQDVEWTKSIRQLNDNGATRLQYAP